MACSRVDGALMLLEMGLRGTEAVHARVASHQVYVLRTDAMIRHAVAIRDYPGIKYSMHVCESHTECVIWTGM